MIKVLPIHLPTHVHFHIAFPGSGELNTTVTLTGMMSLINTNQSYLSTMGISKDSPLVGVIVSVYYIGCAVGAVIASWVADNHGRRPGIFACLATATFGNLLMFVAGLGNLGSKTNVALATMLAGRIIMGLGVGE